MKYHVDKKDDLRYRLRHKLWTELHINICGHRDDGWYRELYFQYRMAGKLHRQLIRLLRDRLRDRLFYL